MTGLLLVGLTSCISDRQLLREYRRDTAYNGFAARPAVDGTYRNGGSTTASLTEHLLRKRGWDFKAPAAYSADVAVSLRYDGAKHILLTVPDAAGRLCTHAVRVKNKGRYLRVQRSLYLIPVPFFFFVQREEKTLLLTDSSGRLVTVRGKSAAIMIVLAAGGQDGYKVTTFQKAAAP